MTLCLAFGDNPPPVSNSHRRSSEQTALTNTCPSVSPPTKRLHTLRHRPRSWNSGTAPSAFGCLERRGAGTPSPAATEQSRAPRDTRHDGRQRPTTAPVLRTATDRIGDRRRPHNEPALPMSPPAQRRVAAKQATPPARPVPRSARCRHRECRRTHRLNGRCNSRSRLGSRRSPPSILSVGHDRQPASLPVELPVLRR
jgi:hypothetical protein